MEYYSDGSDNDIDNLVDDQAAYDAISGDEAIEDNSHNFEESGDTAAPPAPKPVKAKKVVLNPQPKLNFESLQGPKGLLALNELFEGHKFRGSGHEKEDMGNLLKKLEQWTYRLYPKFHFEDSLKRLEALGRKREVQVYLRKIRTGMLDNDFVRQLDDDDDDENSRDGMIAESAPDKVQTDAFDELLSQQIAKTQGTPRAGPQGGDFHTPRSVYSAGPAKHVDTPRPILTEEQLARIEKNRKMALEKKLQKVSESPSVEKSNENVEKDMNCSDLEPSAQKGSDPSSVLNLDDFSEPGASVRPIIADSDKNVMDYSDVDCSVQKVIEPSLVTDLDKSAMNNFDMETSVP